MPEQQDQLKKDIVAILLGLTRCYSALQQVRGEVLSAETQKQVNNALGCGELAIERLTNIQVHVKGCSHGCQSV